MSGRYFAVALVVALCLLTVFLALDGVDRQAAIVLAVP